MIDDRKEIYSNDYMSLFSDGTIGLSDGVGFVDAITKEESRKLYEELKKVFDKESK